MTEHHINAMLRRHRRNDRRVQWLLRATVVVAVAMVLLACLVPMTV